MLRADRRQGRQSIPTAARARMLVLVEHGHVKLHSNNIPCCACAEANNLRRDGDAGKILLDDTRCARLGRSIRASPEPRATAAAASSARAARFLQAGSDYI